MIRKGKGRIVNVVGTAGLKGYPYMVAYSAALHGLIGFTRALSGEVAAHGITVNAVCPGMLNTPSGLAQIGVLAEKLEVTLEEARKQVEGRNPQSRLIEPDEVAGSIVFLASEEAAGVNGQSITVCGGELNS